MSGAQPAQPGYQFQFVAAPADLAPYCNSLYVWSTDQAQLEDCLPAYSGQMVAFLDGVGRMRFGGGQEQATNEAFFLAPLLEARPFTVTGPARCLGVSLNFRGWAALTGLAVNEWHDQIFDPELALGPALAERFAALAPKWRAHAIDDQAMLAEMAQIVRDGIRQLPPQHVKVIDATLEWLSSSFKPELDDLYDKLPFSERQVQRLVARFFGQSPIRLIRRYRAVRAATLLSLPHLSDNIEAEIREAFYDQAHLIKEIRTFTGRTPRRLLANDGSVVNDMLGPDGYGSVDLFGGTQDTQLGKASG